jgi:hypothetical protein
MELKTIHPSIRRLGGIYTFERNGEDMERQPPAIVNPGEMKKATRARGEDTSIPMVEIYTDDQGLAGQEAAPERRVSKIQRDAKKRLGSRKEVMAAEKEVLEQQVAKKISKEKPTEEVVKGVVRKVITESALDDKLSTKKEIAELKLKKSEAKAKKAAAEAFTEYSRAQTYLQFANQRAKEIQKESGIRFKDAKDKATTEWKEMKKAELSGLLTDADTDKKPVVRRKRPVVAPEKVPSSETSKKVMDAEVEKQKAKEMGLKPSGAAKDKRKKLDLIKGLVDALSDDDLKKEYRNIHKFKAFPSKEEMKKAAIRELKKRKGFISSDSESK